MARLEHNDLSGKTWEILFIYIYNDCNIADNKNWIENTFKKRMIERSEKERKKKEKKRK